MKRAGTETWELAGAHERSLAFRKEPSADLSEAFDLGSASRSVQAILCPPAVLVRPRSPARRREEPDHRGTARTHLRYHPRFVTKSTDLDWRCPTPWRCLAAGPPSWGGVPAPGRDSCPEGRAYASWLVRRSGRLRLQVGRSRASIHRGIRAGTFPKQVAAGESSRWRRSDAGCGGGPCGVSTGLDEAARLGRGLLVRASPVSPAAATCVLAGILEETGRGRRS